ncbi:MAG: GNAT family N-acetyltransferase [Candidatus Hodarchaeales archaeon]|jgi:RimJ/RimL family protein N-acetyltransferase
MIELQLNEFKIVLPYLTNLLKYNYIIYSVIDGSVAGRIFVNDRKNIETVLVWDKTNCAGVYIEGKYTPEIASTMNKIIHTIIIPEGKVIEDTKDITSCYHPIEVWEDKLTNEVFKGVDIRKHDRKFFKFDKGVNRILQWKENIPFGLQMIKFDENSSFMKDREFKNLDAVVEMVRYSDDKFGCCVIDEREKIIASWCTSDWRSGKFVEFGVGTDEKYRVRGFGSACAAAALEFAIERGYEHIGWHCWDDNFASAKTAMKAGYIHERTHPVIHFWYNTYDNMVVAVYSYYNRQDYDTALKYFHKTEKMRKEQSEDYLIADLKTDSYFKWLLSTAAACYSRLNRKVEALSLLKIIVKVGLDKPKEFLKKLKEDEDFFNLRESQEYQKILFQIESLIGK